MENFRMQHELIEERTPIVMEFEELTEEQKTALTQAKSPEEILEFTDPQASLGDCGKELKCLNAIHK